MVSTTSTSSGIRRICILARHQHHHHHHHHQHQLQPPSSLSRLIRSLASSKFITHSPLFHPSSQHRLFTTSPSHIPTRSLIPLNRHYTTSPSQPQPQQIPSSTETLIITDRAVSQIQKVTTTSTPPTKLRVTVDSGGCHGFQYLFKLDSEMTEEDVIITKDAASVIIDTVSLDLLRGSKIDFVQELIGSSFQVVDNPKADTGCGCGASFNLKL